MIHRENICRRQHSSCAAWRWCLIYKIAEPHGQDGGLKRGNFSHSGVWSNSIRPLRNCWHLCTTPSSRFGLSAPTNSANRKVPAENECLDRRLSSGHQSTSGFAHTVKGSARDVVTVVASFSFMSVYWRRTVQITHFESKFESLIKMGEKKKFLKSINPQSDSFAP